MIGRLRQDLQVAASFRLHQETIAEFYTAMS
jgi:hypothetical protein